MISTREMVKFDRRERSKRRKSKYCFLFFRHKIRNNGDGMGARCIYCGRLASQCIDYKKET